MEDAGDGWRLRSPHALAWYVVYKVEDDRVVRKMRVRLPLDLSIQS